MPKASTSEADGAKAGPARWWQWVILYPTLAISILSAPFDWYSTPENLKVDATICNSGDIFVRVTTPKQGNFYQWVLLNTIVKDKKTASLPLISSAYAGENATWRTEGSYQVASGEAATVVCQAFMPDGRTIKRHVSTAQGCFDEYVDTYTGQVTRREQVQCRSTC